MLKALRDVAPGNSHWHLIASPGSSMASSGYHIRDVDIRLAQDEICLNEARLHHESQRKSGTPVATYCRSRSRRKSAERHSFRTRKSRGGSFLEEMVKSTDTASTDTSNNSSKIRLAGNSKARRLKDATVLLALHREARTGAPAPFRQGKPRTKPTVPIVVVCVRWSSTPPQFTQKKAELRRIMEEELVPWIWADLQASGRSNCELAQAVAAARFRPAVGSAVAGGAGGEDAGVEEEHRVWEKVVKEDLAVATAVAVVGLNSLASTWRLLPISLARRWRARLSTSSTT
ncbi:unnamed protein product [Jaminaea pallidilutea]